VVSTRRSNAESFGFGNPETTPLSIPTNPATAPNSAGLLTRSDYIATEKDGRRYLGASPSTKSMQRTKDKVGELLVPHYVGPWLEGRDKLNNLLRVWSACFSYGSRQRAYRAIDNHVYDRVRHFLARRHKVHGRGTRQFCHEPVFGDLGVVRLYRDRVRSAAPPCASR